MASHQSKEDKVNREVRLAAKRANQAQRRARFKAAVLAAYGGKCACCGETNPVFLCIDHINNDGAAHRREIGQGKAKVGSGGVIHEWLCKHNFPDGFQILCANCNQAKQTLGICPHQLVA